MIFSVLHLLESLAILAILAIWQYRISKKHFAEIIPESTYEGSIIVPGYNEEITSPKTVENLLLTVDDRIP